jgi:nicotinamidase-related amidase
VKSTNRAGVALDCKLLLSGKVRAMGSEEFIMYKPTFNAFCRTPLDSFLKSKKIDSVAIIAITSPNCVRATQLGATDHDYRVGLALSECAETYDEGSKAMQGEGVQLLKIEELEHLIRDGQKGVSPTESRTNTNCQ